MPFGNAEKSPETGTNQIRRWEKLGQDGGSKGTIPKSPGKNHKKDTFL